MSSVSIGNGHIEYKFFYSKDVPLSAEAVALEGRQNESARMVLFPHRIPVVEIMAAGRGEGHWITSTRLVQTSLGAALRVSSVESREDKDASYCNIHMNSEQYGLEAVLHLTLFHTANALRASVDITNTWDDSLVLESVTPFSTSFGTTLENKKTDFSSWSSYECTNECIGEGRWVKTPVRRFCPALHPELSQRDPQGCHAVFSEGTFSTGTSSPVGVLESERLNMAWAFQIENNGGWRWEFGEDRSDGYFALSGPTWRNNTWSRTLGKDETFSTVPVSICFGADFHEAMAGLTRYRRAVRSQMGRSSFPMIIFNDYMNTINGDPTTEKLLPLINQAADLGVEVFCVDCGWYDDSGDWWPSVGEWKPSTTRFPHGLREVIDRIKDKGMIAGLWLEPESVGIESPVASQLPDEAFFLHDGKRMVEQKRLMLDYRNPMVIDRMNSIVDGLIDEYGVGYFKFDFNIRPGSGTTHAADSSGDGLLEHGRAYLRWIDSLYAKHPGLIIENCSAGGGRTDFAQASHFQLLSTSDQQDYRLYPVISTAAPMTMLPEQAGNWAYPERDMNAEQFAFALCNTMIGHYFLSGYVNTFSEWQNNMVRESIEAYNKEVAPHIVQSEPFWPLGMPAWDSQKVSFGLKDGNSVIVAVWGRNAAEKTTVLPIPGAAGHDASIDVLFPRSLEVNSWAPHWNRELGALTVDVPEREFRARIFSLSLK